MFLQCLITIIWDTQSLMELKLLHKITSYRCIFKKMRLIRY